MLDQAIMAVGFSAILLDVYFALKFIMSRKHMGKAVCLMLIGEGVGAFAITLFAYCSMTDKLEWFVTSSAANAFRCFVLTLAVVTTIHLCYRVNQVDEDT